MTTLKIGLAAFLRSEDGPTTTEYAVLLAMLTIAVLGLMTLLGQHVQQRWAARGD